MYKILSYFVLAITAVIGLTAIYQLNGVTGVLKQFNKESKDAEFYSDYDYPGGGIEPEPTDYAEPSE